MNSEKLVLTMSCPDKPGIVYAVTGLLASVGGNILESQQYNDDAEGRFFIRIEAFVPGGKSTIEAAMTQLAQNYSMDFDIAEIDKPLRTLIMVTKESHCLSDLLAKHHDGRLPIDVVAVVGNHEDLRSIAEFYEQEFIYIPITAESKREAEQQLLNIVREREVELVVLARYMQILSPELCEILAGNVINIHHSFLPSFKGARPYAQAHQRGVKLIGATAHYVTMDLDEGPIIEQDVVRVAHNDALTDLVAKGAEVERQVLSRAVRWHAEHRILMNGSRTVIFS
ncbi:formyltetrahydrofolate deformylase [Arcanobacterium pluranimalium]|uniref:formyltetrahydrofolate deformylase n=1 Tax=Arcanobacterium pluranimalium TaxID=108028 RepID=UPI001956FB26|nr:formyltetrahydrofolate deformylase [Arcanobacterium pluranimalium]MBM7825059.1 formyltetrahydrofolate deformylase [Arcanobacterium pluranimalium]